MVYQKEETVKILVWIIAALIAGGSGSFVYRKIDPPRADPFTGTQGRNIEKRMENLEEYLSKDEINVTKIFGEQKAIFVQLDQIRKEMIRDRSSFREELDKKPPRWLINLTEDMKQGQKELESEVAEIKSMLKADGRGDSKFYWYPR